MNLGVVIPRWNDGQALCETLDAINRLDGVNRMIVADGLAGIRSQPNGGILLFRSGFSPRYRHTWYYRRTKRNCCSKKNGLRVRQQLF